MTLSKTRSVHAGKASLANLIRSLGPVGDFSAGKMDSGIAAVAGDFSLYVAAMHLHSTGAIGFFPGPVSHVSLFNRAITDAECNAMRLTALNGA